MNVNNLPAPSYAMVVSENAFIKHLVEYQHQLVQHHCTHAQNYYEDALRWRTFKTMLAAKEGAAKVAETEAKVDAKIAKQG